MYTGRPEQGGLLLDPSQIVLSHAELLVGYSSWRWDFAFPFNPALVGVEVHFQAVIPKIDPRRRFGLAVVAPTHVSLTSPVALSD